MDPAEHFLRCQRIEQHGCRRTRREDAVDPVWQLDLNTTWTYHRLTVNYGFNWSSKTRRYTNETQRADPNYVLPQYFYFSPHADYDLQVRYDFSIKFAAFVGCNNCSDQRPDISDPQPSEPVSPLGRYVYAGVEARF